MSQAVAVSAEFPGALWLPAHESNFRAAGRKSYARIVIHCTDGRADPRPVARMWQMPSHGSSAHFVIGQDGTIVQAVPLSAVAFHAHSASADSVGIEHCARTPRELGKDDPGMPPTEVQYQASAELVAWLLKRAGLPATRAVVVGHSEADRKTTHTRCPLGCGWDWARYMALLEQLMPARVVG